MQVLTNHSSVALTQHQPHTQAGSDTVTTHSKWQSVLEFVTNISRYVDPVIYTEVQKHGSLQDVCSVLGRVCE